MKLGELFLRVMIGLHWLDPERIAGIWEQVLCYGNLDPHSAKPEDAMQLCCALKSMYCEEGWITKAHRNGTFDKAHTVPACLHLDPVTGLFPVRPPPSVDELIQMMREWDA